MNTELQSLQLAKGVLVDAAINIKDEWKDNNSSVLEQVHGYVAKWLEALLEELASKDVSVDSERITEIVSILLHEASRDIKVSRCIVTEKTRQQWALQILKDAVRLCNSHIAAVEQEKLTDSGEIQTVSGNIPLVGSPLKQFLKRFKREK